MAQNQSLGTTAYKKKKARESGYEKFTKTSGQDGRLGQYCAYLLP